MTQTHQFADWRVPEASLVRNPTSLGPCFVRNVVLHELCHHIRILFHYIYIYIYISLCVCVLIIVDQINISHSIPLPSPNCRLLNFSCRSASCFCRQSCVAPGFTRAERCWSWREVRTCRTEQQTLQKERFHLGQFGLHPTDCCTYGDFPMKNRGFIQFKRKFGFDWSIFSDLTNRNGRIHCSRCSVLGSHFIIAGICPIFWKVVFSNGNVHFDQFKWGEACIPIGCESAGNLQRILVRRQWQAGDPSKIV